MGQGLMLPLFPSNPVILVLVGPNTLVKAPDPGKTPDPPTLFPHDPAPLLSRMILHGLKVLMVKGGQGVTLSPHPPPLPFPPLNWPQWGVEEVKSPLVE